MTPFLIILPIVILLLLVVSRKPIRLGNRGELKVKRALGKNIQDEKYVINDLLIVYEGKSSQIDHVLITRTGIFVIETKNYSGRIYGIGDQREWTQVLQYGNVKNKLYNPIMQNKSHIYALSKVIGRNDCFVSIIVFPKAELEIKAATPVGDIDIIEETLKSRTEMIFKVEEINEIYAKLLEIKNNPQISAREHVSLRVMLSYYVISRLLDYDFGLRVMLSYYVISRPPIYKGVFFV